MVDSRDAGKPDDHDHAPPQISRDHEGQFLAESCPQDRVLDIVFVPEYDSSYLLVVLTDKRNSGSENGKTKPMAYVDR
jgi:hypothetical protein